MFLMNTAVGIYSCLWRLLLGLVIGIVVISKLHRPVLLKGFEKKDRGESYYKYRRAVSDTVFSYIKSNNKTNVMGTTTGHVMGQIFHYCH